MNNPIRILLVDDSSHFLEAARDFLQFQERFNVIGSASEGLDAVAQSEQLQPDIILLDLNLGDRSGLELIPIFKEKLPQARIIVLTIMEDACYRAASLQAGADAFVSKTAMSNSLIATMLELVKPAPVGRPGRAKAGVRAEKIKKKRGMKGTRVTSKSKKRKTKTRMKKERIA